MQKIINKPDEVVDEMVQGYVKAYADLVAETDNPRVLKYIGAPVSDKVGVVTGGGSGHKPAFLGYIGKNMVAAMLRGVGFEVRDIGINIGTARFISEVSEYAPDILGLSALLTTTMPEMKKVLDSLVVKGLRSTVKVMVGGAPINEKFARDIGADGYAPDCGEAIVVAKNLMHDLR